VIFRLPYKRTLAAIFLALYIFIATPVQLWHQHNYSTNAKSYSRTNNNNAATLAASQSADKSITEDCLICSHHYSVFIDDPVTVFVSAPEFSVPKYSGYCVPAPSFPVLSRSNKGPPALV
jgi:hypothetical protein